MMLVVDQGSSGSCSNYYQAEMVNPREHQPGTSAWVDFIVGQINPPASPYLLLH